LRREIRKAEAEIALAMQSRDASGASKLAAHLKELRHFENQWKKQLSLLQDEVVVNG